MRKTRTIITIILLCFVTISSLPTISYKASTSTDFRRIITEDTPIYSDSLGINLLFYLPYTYYVKVIEYGETLSHVECYGTGKSIAIDGYVPTLMLYKDDLPVPSPYMEKEIMTLSTSVLYADKSLSTPLQYIFSNRNLIYYGQIKADDNSIIFYVSYNNKLGYVKESEIIPFDLPYHPNELTFLTPEPNQPESPPEQESAENLLTLRIVIIVSLLFAGIIALFIALKNKPEKKNSVGYYDENEYE